MSLSINGKSFGFHPKVSGSTPLRDANLISARSAVGSASVLGTEGRPFEPGRADHFKLGVTQLVACLPWKQKVVGSSPTT